MKKQHSDLLIRLFYFCNRITLRYHFLKTQIWYKSFLKESGKGSIIIKPILITPEFIKFGSNIQVRNNARIEGVKQYAGMCFNPLIHFQDNVSVEQNLHLTCAESIVIGKNTAIAANVSITDINHIYIDINVSVEKQAIDVNPVTIAEDCKIYNNAVILPGTNIGKHCVVGANSIVSGNFPDFCIIAGSPAKIVKRYSFKDNTWLKTDKEGNFLA